jgi:hypothetical protein
MAKGSSASSESPDFYIRNENMKLKQDIVNIAGNIGLSYSAFLRREIIKLRDQYPEDMRKLRTD